MIRAQISPLECLKVKLPRYRHTGAPTHFQKQVGRGTWLGACTLPTPHTFLNCPLHMILHRGNVRQYNFSKEAVSGAPVTLYWTALAISKTIWNHRLDKTSLIDMENQGVKYLQFAFVMPLLVNMFRSNFWEYLASHPRKISLCWRCNVYALFQPLLNALLLQSTVWCRSYSAIFKDWFHNSCCALCCLLWFIPWHALLGTHHSYSTLAIVYVSALG